MPGNETVFHPVGSFPRYAIDPAVDYWAMVVVAILVAVSVLYCLTEARKQQSMLPIIILVASLTTITIEPFFEVLGAVAHPTAGVTPGVTLLNRQMPVYDALIYIFYWSGSVFFIVDKINKGITMNAWFKLAALFIASAFAFEVLPLHYGMWTYYNTQPMQIAGFPAWWAFTNVHAVIALAVAVALLHRHLGPIRSWVIVPLYPGLIFGTHMFAAFPAYAVVSSTSKHALALLGTVLAIVLSCSLIWLYATIVCTDRDASRLVHKP
jgi:hypothetical protein